MNDLRWAVHDANGEKLGDLHPEDVKRGQDGAIVLLCREDDPVVAEHIVKPPPSP